ncbi:GNAT family N-acetyltransferase [Pseudonocardia spinosispora]|uniref:GNAT family N-acetyltransferase n=1 Tax=Pseudonocardia spinosispora TaxID=103441 RepID=UPI0004250242|nr:hypothetical protein [Pseudonocardia spinosispora]
MFDQLLHEYLRALMAPAHRVGPFLVSFDAHDAGLFRNYAVPDDTTVPTQKEVDELVAAFTERGRTPRFEYLPDLCPEVEPALLAAGFTVEHRLPIMTCPPTEVRSRPAPPEVELLLAHSDEQLREVAEACNEAYLQPGVTDHDVARLRRTLDRGALVVLAADRATGRGVGGGLCGAPHKGVSELAAIGVRAPFRRRGIATAMTGLLTRSCPAAGISTPFLTPEAEPEKCLYEAIGYRQVTEILHISR